MSPMAGDQLLMFGTPFQTTNFNRIVRSINLTLKQTSWNLAQLKIINFTISRYLYFFYLKNENKVAFCPPDV